MSRNGDQCAVSTRQHLGSSFLKNNSFVVLGTEFESPGRVLLFTTEPAPKTYFYVCVYDVYVLCEGYVHVRAGIHGGQ